MPKNNTVPLFVFLIGDPKQNVNSFMTPFSDSVFYALSHGSLGFAFHGSFFNHSLIGQNSSTAIRIFTMAVDRAAMENKTEATM